MSNTKEPFEPWFHEASGFWCKKVKSQLYYLDKDYKAAKKRLRLILEAHKTGDRPPNDWIWYTYKFAATGLVECGNHPAECTTGNLEASFVAHRQLVADLRA